MLQNAIDMLTNGLAYALGLAANVLIRPSSFLSVWMLWATFAIAVLWYRRNGSRVRSWKVLRRGLFPRHHLTGRSARADWLLTVLNHLVFTTGFIATLLSLATLGGSVRHLLADLTGVSQATVIAPWAAQALTTLMAFVAYEFAYYVDHWLKHQVPFLWHFHKVHHTAETLSPLVNFRMHPIDGYLFAALTGLAGGASMGVSTWLFGSEVLPFSIGGSNLILVTFAYLVISLQHTHAWIPFTGRLGHVLLSPAHHQIHHSADPRHYNSNYGSVIALFDWLFGTLRVPSKTSPRLRFGVNDLTHDPHSLAGLLIVPVRDALGELGPQQSGDSPPNRPATDCA
ncbi:sterol desaturase family protein [Novosphingobium sp. B 225]|uniref:sterol desaturase family protein n=1 Tax=Novosphingobium sp. B 225 TaxID=1961849 RepID=UPI001124F568|nr:sterol desaturase family protein [Novosphingobium sp. B 225]